MNRPSSVRAAVALGATAVLVAAVPLSALAAQPRKDAGYQGASSQKAGDLTLPVDLRITADGKSVSRFDIQWTSKCASPTGRGAIGGLSVTRKMAKGGPVVISKEGSFGDSTSFTRALGNNQTGLFAVVLKGKFTKKTLAKGTFKVTVSIKDATGQQVDTCDTGTINWQVRD